MVELVLFIETVEFLMEIASSFGLLNNEEVLFLAFD